LDDDVARVGAVRDALGASYTLMVDANQGWSRLDAARATRALAEFDLRWLEEPLDFQDVEGLAQLRGESDIPIAAGETAYGVRGMQELLRAGAVDVLQPDLMRCGGVTPFLSVAALASAHRVALMPHLYSDAAAHLLGLVPAGGMIEYLPGWFDHLYGRPAITAGRLAPSERAGLGLYFDPGAPGSTVLARVSVE
jgi:mandelate racemase